MRNSRFFIYAMLTVYIAFVPLSVAANGTSSQSSVGSGDSAAPTPIQRAAPVIAPVDSSAISILPSSAVPVIPQLGGISSSAATQAAAEREGQEIEIFAYRHWSGNSYRQKNFSTLVIRDNDEWNAFWDYARMRAPSVLPRDNMAVVIILGERPNDGHSVRVSSIRQVENSFTVSYIENKSPRSRPSDHVIVPWVVQLLPRTQGRVRFVQVLTEN